MGLISKYLTLLLFIFIFYSFTPSNLQASLLYETFDSNNSNNWTVQRNTCGSNWIAQNETYGIQINSPCITETTPNSLNLESVPNYSIELDMIIGNSTNMDRNFVFKYKDSANWYGVHLLNNNLYVHKVVNGVEYFLPNWHTQYGFNPNTTYNFKVEVQGNKFTIYINGNQHVVLEDQLPYFISKNIALQASAGGIQQSEVWFDNVVVRELPQPTDTPSPSPSPSPSLSPSPSPSPSPTPIPTPTSPSFNVVNLKQYSIPWGEKIYGFTNKTISEFGCALTSASMILQYYGHPINPDQLNLWLKNQPDGYIRNGLVNWLAITRYTRLNDSLISPTLEYNRYGEDHDKLSQELFNQRPAILKLPGHFVVAKSIIGDTYGINDPGYANRATLDSYNNTFLSLNTFRPTHTDLSYMMFVVDKNINLILKDKNGNLIETQSFTETPIQSIYNSNLYTGETVKIYLVEKPQTQNYTVEISGPKGKYELNAYIYDETGNYTKKTFNGRLSGQDVDSYTIKYQKKNKIERDMLRDKLKLDNWFKYFFKSFKYGN